MCAASHSPAGTDPRHDADPAETAEWRDGLQSLVEASGADRAGYETYLNSEGLIYLRLKTYQVSVTLPDGLTYKNGGRLTQDCLDLTPITISVTDPDNY
ncbi:hypothetical protein, partial [Escherichia coli]|uniref:hypothetical protein n=1 Tax=Escherichia coli TaxID=562 RepID=UPI0022838595